MINSKFPTQSYWSYDKQDCPAPYASILCAKVGYTTTPQSMIYRSLFQFDIGSLLDKHVQKAILSMDTVYSYTNTDYKTEVHVAGTITSDTTWSNNASTWGASVGATSSHAHDLVRRRTEFGVTTAVQKASKGTSTRLTLGLRAANESSVSYWKKFDASKAYLTVDYNSFPKPPSPVTIEGQACKTGASRPYVRTFTPTATGKLTDPDSGETLKGQFYWWKVGTGRSGTDMVAQGSIANGGTAIAKIPAGRLVENVPYALQAITNDGIDNGQPTNCEFTVDVTAPPVPGTPASSSYPADGAAHGGAGVTGAFTLKPPSSVPSDFWGYAYTLDPGVSAAAATQVAAPATSAAPVTTCTGPSQAPAPASDRSVAICLTPSVDRAYTLRVWAKDKAGNFSSPATYSFTVAAGSGPAARWTFDDSTGADMTEHGNTATVTAGAFEAGRGKYGKALTGNGTSTYATTGGPIVSRDSAGKTVTLHPNQSFSVAATVKLTSTTGTGQRAIVAQDGSRTSPFVLSYSIADKKWRFAVAGSDTDAPTTAVVLSDATAAANTWTRLYATYDGSTHVLRLFVNGAQQSGSATSATFDSAKPVTIGRGLQAGVASGYFVGAIDDVRIYSRVVNASETEFTNMQRPNPPVVTLPDPPTAYAGGTLKVNLDAGGDTAVTTVTYQLATATLTTEVLSTAGGSKQVTIPVPASLSGPTSLYVTAVDAAKIVSTVDVYEVMVEQPTVLTGTVTNASAVALKGITVRLSPGDLTQVTDANGAYTFSTVQDTTYTMTADTDGIGCAAASVERDVVLAGNTTVNLILAPDADEFGYTCQTAASTPFVPGSTRLALTGDDEATQVATLPFAVPYYGNSYNSLWVSTNGFVSFTDPAARNVYSGASLPDRHNAPSAALAPYWSDLVVDASASVWTAVTGTGTDQRYVIEWRNALLAGTASRVSFETVIANNGDITFNYTGLADDLAKGSYTAVGVTSPGGNYGLQYSYEQPDLAAGTAVTVVAPADGHDLVGSLTGTMLNQEGEPTAGVHVWLDDTATETDEFGTYRFDDVENGTYSLYGAQGCADVEDANVAVTGDGTIDTVYDAVMDVATDTYGNRCSLSTAAWTPGDTAVSFGTGFETSVALPFPVTFYGHAFSTVDVQNWGAVAFTDTADSALGGGVQVWPGADPIFDAQSKVYTKTVGTGPNRQFVIEWRDVGLTGVTGTRVDLELVIAENSAITATIHNPPDRAVTSKDIEIYYWGNDYNSIQYYEDGNGLRAGKSVTFTPPTAA